MQEFRPFYLKSSDQSSFKKNHTGPNSSFSMFLVFSDWNFADESKILHEFFKNSDWFEKQLNFAVIPPPKLSDFVKLS